MPRYDFGCPACGEQFERLVSLSDFNKPQECEACKAPGCARLLTTVGFVLRGNDWPGKNLKVAGQMAKKREAVTAKQEVLKREAPGMRLAPNVGGELTGTWGEAAKLAKSKGIDTTSYEQRAKAE